MKPEGTSFEYFATLRDTDGARLNEAAIDRARELKVSGLVIVYSSLRMLLSAQSVGYGASMTSPTPQNEAIARAKIETVLNTRRSTRLQRENMQRIDATREDFDGNAGLSCRDDYSGTVGSLFGGGVAVFAESDKRLFVGAIAFSGGTEEQDEAICRAAVYKVGLYSDLGISVKSISHIQRDELGTCFHCNSFSKGRLSGLAFEFNSYDEADLATIAFGDDTRTFRQHGFTEVEVVACKRHRVSLKLLEDLSRDYGEIIPELVEEAKKNNS